MCSQSGSETICCQLSRASVDELDIWYTDGVGIEVGPVDSGNRVKSWNMLASEEAGH